MHYRDTLAIALTTMDERQKKYASPEVNFARIASLASILLNRNVTPYEIAMIHLCTKLGRHIETPTYDDNIVDGVNYLAFVGTFAGQHFDGLGEMRRVEIMKGMEEALKPILTEEEMQAVMEASK
jgi:hypothetical protein